METITSQDLQALVNSEIVTVRGISGVETTVEVAKQAPQVCQIHAMSGKVFDLVAYIPEIDQFNVEEIL